MKTENNPIQAVAVCCSSQAEILIQYDHHRVRVGGRWGILITYHWLMSEEDREARQVKVVFNPSQMHIPTEDQTRAMVFQHPLAPQEVQDIINLLKFSDTDK